MLPKVQTLWSWLAHPLQLCFVLAAVLLAAGCAPDSPEVDDEFADDEVQMADDRFGAPYEIVTSRSPSEPDTPPALSGDSLFVEVVYYGGCDDHDFRLHHETSQDTTRFWMEHERPRGDCDERVFHELEFEVPENSLQAPTVVLLNPQGFDAHVLRWGETAR